MGKALPILVALATVPFITLAGCGGHPARWEVTAENKGDLPCAITVATGADGSSKAHVDDLGKGRGHALIAGDTDTVIRSVSVVRGEDEQVLKPDARLPVGQRYLIVVGADGKVHASVQKM